MAAGGFVDEVAVVFFEKNEASADLSPASGIQTFVNPAADADNDSVLDVVEVLRSMQWYTTGTFTRFAGPSVFTSINAGEHNGGTAIGLGLQEACDVLGGSAADDQRVVLFTDGHNNKNPHLEDVLPCDPNVPVYAFGLGPDGECTDGSEVTFGELANHVPGTGGACYDITSVYTLPDVLGGFFTPEVTAARAILDGGTPVNLTTGVTPALPYEGFGEVDLSWLAEGLDDEHTVCFELDVEVGEESGTIGDCVTLFLNEAPTLALGADLVVDEGDLITLDLSGADDPDEDPLNTIWEVLTVEGPPLAAPAEGQQAAAWLALDDGSYDVTLTVDDGLADAADSVTITVRNEDPEVAWSFFDGTGSGVVSLAGQVHDPGLMDVPTITIDWGDGDLETIDPAAQGPGWSAFVAGHAYLDPGAYTVVLTVDDHDGGLFVDMASAHHSPPVAVWAGSSTLRKSLEWSGCSGTITGLVHSNQDLWLGGGGKAIDGVVEHVGGTHLRGDITLSDAPAVGAVAPSPVQFEASAWRPGGVPRPRATVRPGTTRRRGVSRAPGR
jgi:hypothetical protein